MLTSSSLTRHSLRVGALRKRIWRTTPILHLGCVAPRRCFYDGGQSLVVEEVVSADQMNGRLRKHIEEYKTSFKVPKSDFLFQSQIPRSQLGQIVTAVGFLGKRRDIGRTLTFVPLVGGNGQKVQVFARSEVNGEATKVLKRILENSAVSVTGILGRKYNENKSDKEPDAAAPKDYCLLEDLEIRIQRIDCLGSFPRNLKLEPNQQYEPKDRNLQLRFDQGLSKRIRFRSDVAAFTRKSLADFQEIETPILFKSTPEGAREFVVPTRRPGYAYGLPQSPQQYKQILMASGIHRYIQFAKCFRDEDFRADRQPEFTQVDLEMAWADGEDVMQRVERFMKDLWREFAKPGTTISSPLSEAPFLRMTYEEAMSKHGSDKPDLRIKDLIYRIDHIIPDNLKGMLTSIQDPIIDACKIRLDGDPATIKKFVGKFMDSPGANVVRDNGDAPGIFVVDPRRPIGGLHAFGFEGSEAIKALYAEANDCHAEFEEGDLLLLQARENVPYSGGSTVLGKLRIAIYKAALAQDLIKPDSDHHFLWVTNFPMFTANDGTEPGQEGDSGFSSTHHPFTAPKTAADVDLLLTDPLKAIADHYDLVLNGVELGGGSRRIHNAEMQKFVMREILKINPKRMSDFNHLFLALSSGCPPHAGLAIGFDRLVAVMQGRDSIRDVIAFPKDKNGSDILVRSPSKLSNGRMEEYYLQIKDKKAYQREAKRQEIETQKVKALESLKVLLDTITGLGGYSAPSEGSEYKQVYDGIRASQDSKIETYLPGTSPDPSETPHYRPGELLPYAMMLYNRVGGRFLKESLNGFEALIESLGAEIEESTKFLDMDGPATTPPGKASAASRLEKLHSELMTEILSQLRSLEVAESDHEYLEEIELTRRQLEETLEPVQLLYSSLKNLEPMLESLNKELERRIKDISVDSDHDSSN